MKRLKWIDRDGAGKAGSLADRDTNHLAGMVRFTAKHWSMKTPSSTAAPVTTLAENIKLAFTRQMARLLF